MEWQLRTEEPRVGRQPLAQVQGSGDYREGKADATLHLASAKGGVADARGTLRADLSLPSLVKGVAWLEAPVEAQLDAEAFNLAVLGDLSASLRSLAGILSGHAAVSGTLGAPAPRGTLRLRDGAFVVAGYGFYQEVSLDLSASDRLIDLAGLTARSGGGSLSLSGKGERASTSEPYRLTAKLALSQAPLIVDGQLVAHLTAETESITGEVQGARASLAVKVARLVVDLPQASSKDLTSLDPNADIAIVDARLWHGSHGALAGVAFSRVWSDARQPLEQRAFSGSLVSDQTNFHQASCWRRG